MKKETQMKPIMKKTSIAIMMTSLLAQGSTFAQIGVGLAVTSLLGIKTAKAQEVSNTNQQVYKSLLLLSLDKPLATAPKMFNIANTNKIVVDLENVDNTFEAPKILPNDPLLSKIESEKYGNMVRLLIETKSPVKYGFENQNHQTFLIFESSTKFENVENVLNGQMNTVAQKQNQTTNTSIINNAAVILPKVNQPVVVAQNNVNFDKIDKINIKKEGAKENILTFDLSNNEIKPKFVKNNNQLIIDFDNTLIPNAFQKRIDTTSLGGVVQNMNISMQGNNGEITLTQDGNWDYDFYQVGSKLVVHVKSEDLKEAKKYTGKKLTLNFQNMDVRAILQVIADFTGLNVMASDKVQGSMTLRLKDVPWDQALDLVLQSQGLQKMKEGNVIWVATNAEIQQMNKEKLALQQEKEALEPLKLKFFQINYYKAEDLKKILEGKSGIGKDTNKFDFLSSRGSIGVDQRNNILFVQDTESHLEKINKIISTLDVPTKQVLVQAKIVIATNDFGKQLGAKFGINAGHSFGANSIGIGGNLGSSTTNASGLTSSTPITPISDLAANAINSVAPGAIGLTLLNISGNALGVELSALEQNNKGKVLSSPRLLTEDNQQALIEQGTEIPYVTPSTANSPPTVAFKKAVLSLGVTPQITPNGDITMKLNITKDDVGQYINVQGGGQIPSIDTRKINTMVTVKDGQTVVLGGVYEIDTSNSVNKIPFFGDLPVVGHLFKQNGESSTKGELLIFITPYIVTSNELNENKVASNGITLSQ
jgi:type IV pilus assembly protein PilQ